MTWSTSRSGILTSAVDRNSTLLIHVSTGGSSSGAPAVSTILLTGPSCGSRLNTRAFYLNTLTLEAELRLQHNKTTSRKTAHEIFLSGREVHRNFESVRVVSAIMGGFTDHSHGDRDAIRFASFANASSTFCPVFADV